MSWLQELLVAEIRTALRNRGWDQAYLAHLAGITQKHLSAILLGKAEGSLALWSDLLRITGTQAQIHTAIEANRAATCPKCDSPGQRRAFCNDVWHGETS